MTKRQYNDMKETAPARELLLYNYEPATVLKPFVLLLNVALVNSNIFLRKKLYLFLHLHIQFQFFQPHISRSIAWHTPVTSRRQGNCTDFRAVGQA